MIASFSGNSRQVKCNLVQDTQKEAINMMNTHNRSVSPDHIFVSLLMILVGLMTIVLNMPTKGLSLFVGFGIVLTLAGMGTAIWEVKQQEPVDNCPTPEGC